MCSFVAQSGASRALAAALLAVTVSASILATEPPQPRVLLRNVYVPAGDLASWPTEGDAYLPVEATRLEALLEAANPAPQSGTPQVLETHLYGSVDTLGNVIGLGAMQLRRTADSSPWLSFAPSGVHVAKATWRKQATAARLGYWGSSRGVAVEVLQDDWLDFDWRVAAPESSSAGQEYVVTLPAALATVLMLDLPLGQTPEGLEEGGVLVTLAAELPASETASASFHSQLPSVAPNKARWLLRSGPGGKLAWRIRSTDRTGESQGLPASFRENLEYRLAESGISLSQQFTIAASENLPQPLWIEALPSLVIRSVSWDGVPQPTRRRDDQRGYLVVLPPHQEASASGHRLAVDAWHPLESTTMQLPRLQLPQLFWLSGRVSLRIDSALQLVDLRLRNAVPTLAAGKPPRRQMHFDELGPRARIDLQANRRVVDREVRVGRVVDLSTTDTKATVFTHFEGPAQAAVNVLSARLVEGWRPRTVTADAPYEVEDWYVAEGDGKRRLTVRASLQTAQSVAEPPPLRLAVEADRSIAASEAWLPLADCDVLRWENAEVGDSLLTFRVEDGNELEWNPQPAAMGEDAAMPYLGTLLPATTASAVYDRSQLADASRLYLKPAAPEFDIAVTTSLIDEVDHWVVRHRIECTPQRGSVEELQVRTTMPASTAFRWRLEGDEQWQTETLPVAGASADGTAENVLWQLPLPRRQTGPFVVLLEQVPVPGASCSCPPIDVPGAQSVQQLVEIRSPNSRRIEVDAVGWQLTAADSDGDLPLHSKWRREPGQQSLRLEARRRTSGLALPRARIADAALESTYAPGMPARHRFRFAIANQSESEVRCMLPETASNIFWRRLNSNTGGEASLPVEANEFALPLVLEPGWQWFELAFSMADTTIEQGSALEAPWPQLSVPAIEGRWVVEYPSTFQARVLGRAQRSPAAGERLFGMLSATAGPIDLRTADGAFTSTEISLNKVVDELPSVTFVHLPTLQAWRSLVLVLAMILGYWLWHQRVALVVVTAVAAVAALLLPASSYAWATAVWGGMLAALAIRGLEVATRALKNRAAASDVSAFAASSTSLWLLALALAGMPAAAADSPRRSIESILIPVDGQGQLAGDDRFVTPRLLAELIRREQQRREAAEWVISSPRYSGGLVTRTPATLAPSDAWEMAFDLEVERGGTTVELPIAKSDAAWASEIFLDGIPAAMQWADDANATHFRVPRAGRYRARLAFRPNLRIADEDTTLRLRIPPLPGAMLRLAVPKQIAGLLVGGHAVPPAESVDETREVPLGMIDELVVSWPSVSPTVKTSDWAAEQWEWLDVTATEATLEGTYYLVGPNAEPPTLELRIDDQPLEQVNSTVDSSTTGRGTIESAAAGEATAPRSALGAWQLTGPPEMEPSGDGTYLVRFRLQIDRPQPFGRLRLPQLELAGIVPGKRHLGVTHSNDLTVTLNGGVAGTAEMHEAELARYWPGRQPPRQIVSVDAEAPPVIVSSRPVTTTLSPEEAIDLCVFDDRVEVVYRGAFGGSARPAYFQQVQVPLEMEIADVQLNVRGRSEVLDFGRPEPGRLMVFFAEPLELPFELTIVGSLPISGSRSSGEELTVQVPRITATSETSMPQQVSLYAADHLAVEIADRNDVSQLVESLGEPLSTWRCYGVSAFLASADRDSPLRLRVSSNRPQFDASLLTTMIRQDRTWIAEVNILLDVFEGSLPEVVLNWPAAMIGEVNLDGDAYMSIEPGSDPTAKQLRLRLTRAIDAGQQIRLMLQSAVRSDSPTAVLCPQIHVHQARSTQHYFALTDAKPGKWNWTGAQRVAAPPEAIEPLLAAMPTAVLLEATQARPTVRWAATPVGEPSYQLPLGDIDAELDSSGVATLRTQLVVPPLGIDNCNIEIPAGQKLVQVLVDGVPGVTSQTESGAPRLAVPDSALPHLIELVTIADRAAQSSVGIRPAGLSRDGSDFEVAHQVWSVHASDGTVEVAGASIARLPQVEVAALRLNQLLAASAGSSRAIDAGPASCRRAWEDELTRAEQALREALAQLPAETPDLVNASLATADYGELLKRASEELARRRGQPNGSTSAEDTQPASVSPAEVPERVVFVQSTAEPVRLEVFDTPASDQAVRWLLALAAAGLATFVVATGDRFTWPAANYEWVFPTVAVLGLLWWLCLWPRTVGLLLSLAAVVLWLRWQRIRGA